MIASSEKKNAAQTPAAKRLAALLSDDFSDANDRAGHLVREIVRRTLERLSPTLRPKLQDVIDVALARIDVKASLRYWLRQKDGSAITLTALNCFEIDFFKYAHEEVLIPILFSPMTSGKSLVLDSKLLTPAGSLCMGDIRIGDLVVGSSHEPRLVTGVFPQGELNAFRLTLNDGAFAECSLDHLWEVVIEGEPGPEVLTLKQIMLRLAQTRAGCWFPRLNDTGKSLVSLRSINPIGLTECQCISVDAPDSLYATDSGILTHNTTLIRGLICFEIGQNQDTMKQLICQSDAAARQRGLKIMDTLESPHYKKIFPHIKKDLRQWGNERLLVHRTKAAAGEITRETKGNAGGVDATLTCIGVTSRAITGTRTDLSDLDDVVTVESGLQYPKEGMTVKESLNTKVFTRDQAPIGQTATVYDRRDNETRFRIIGTPYAQDDPVYEMRDWSGATTVLIGVNETFTAYNVQIWKLPKRYYKLLKRKYGTGPAGQFPACADHVETELKERDRDTGFCQACNARRPIRWVFPPLDDVNKKYCEEQGIPIVLEHELGDGVSTDLMNPPDFTMEIPLAIHRGWYLDKHRGTDGEESRFNLPYRCQVYAESQMAFPNFSNSVLEYYRDKPEVGIDNKIEMRVEMLPVYTVQKGENLNLVIGRSETFGGNAKQSGWVSRLVDPPNDSKIKIAWIDLSGMNRAGTVCTVAVLTPQHRRRIVEISKGAWSGAEITELIDCVFTYHEDLQLCYIESVGTQKLFVDEALKHKDKYAWWSKVRYFDKTTTKKADAQIGILTMGTSFSNGSFEIPNTLRMAGHGRKCPCGYCVGIMDGMNQTRQAEVKSDVLITFWGIHLQMPASFRPPQTIAPTTQQRAVSGYDLMNARPSSAMARAILGEIMPGATTTSRQTVTGEKEVQETRDNTDGADNQESQTTQRRDAVRSILPRSRESEDPFRPDTPGWK